VPSTFEDQIRSGLFGLPAEPVDFNVSAIAAHPKGIQTCEQ
jgi:hypothetical protein